MANESTKKLVLNAPLGDVLAEDGRVDLAVLARKIGVSVPEIAKVVGKSRSLLQKSPTATSAQRRALKVVDRINDLAGELGGLKFAIAPLDQNADAPARQSIDPRGALGRRPVLRDRHRFY